jgi:hypothetical protein
MITRLAAAKLFEEPLDASKGQLHLRRTKQVFHTRGEWPLTRRPRSSMLCQAHPAVFMRDSVANKSIEVRRIVSIANRPDQKTWTRGTGESDRRRRRRWLSGPRLAGRKHFYDRHIAIRRKRRPRTASLCHSPLFAGARCRVATHAPDPAERAPVAFYGRFRHG